MVHLCVVRLNEELLRHVHRGSRQLKSVVLRRVGLLCVVRGHGIHLHEVLRRVGLLCVVRGRGIHLRVVLTNALKCVGQMYEVRSHGICLHGIHLRVVRLHEGQSCVG